MESELPIPGAANTKLQLPACLVVSGEASHPTSRAASLPTGPTSHKSDAPTNALSIHEVEHEGTFVLALTGFAAAACATLLFPCSLSIVIAAEIVICLFAVFRCIDVTTGRSHLCDDESIKDGVLL